MTTGGFVPERARGATPAGRGSLLAALDLESIETGMFRGRTGRPMAPTYGGEVACQALLAAGTTVAAERHPHSLHAYFLRRGDPTCPVLYQVEQVHDGGSSSARSVVALQHGAPILVLNASFHVPEIGLAHQEPGLDVPLPEQLPPAAATVAGSDAEQRDWFASISARFPLELRFHDELPRSATSGGELVPPRQRFWLRACEPLPDDPLRQACALTYASDLFLLSSAPPPHGLTVGRHGRQYASLDHSIWFHAPFRADTWLHMTQESPWAGGARALYRGQVHDRTGRLVASVAHEGLVRVREHPRSGGCGM